MIWQHQHTFICTWYRTHMPQQDCPYHSCMTMGWRKKSITYILHHYQLFHDNAALKSLAHADLLWARVADIPLRNPSQNVIYRQLLLSQKITLLWPWTRCTHADWYSMEDRPRTICPPLKIYHLLASQLVGVVNTAQRKHALVYYDPGRDVPIWFQNKYGGYAKKCIVPPQPISHPLASSSSRLICALYLNWKVSIDGTWFRGSGVVIVGGDKENVQLFSEQRCR